MKKNLALISAAALMLTFSACKSQYTAAYTEADSSTPYSSKVQNDDETTNNYLASKTAQPTEPENVRTEKYTVVTGDESQLKHYNVIVGSFRSQENATRLHQSLQSQYRPLIVMNENGMYRVVISTHDTYQEAKAQIAQINGTYPDAWVLVRQK
ncbi:MAG: SPOR domain-containing protein [Paludibacteraceae bacterium]|nr:SPOR domain-containing protein [Paludibacteraceae bacterium]